MKTLILAVAALGLMSAGSVSADGPSPMLTVKITSFIHLSNSPTDVTAEICGTVTINAAELFPKIGNIIPVTVTVDPGPHQGSYTTQIDQSGHFCTLVATYTGTATAEAWMGGGNSATSELARIRDNSRK